LCFLCLFVAPDSVFYFAPLVTKDTGLAATAAEVTSGLRWSVGVLECRNPIVAIIGTGVAI